VLSSASDVLHHAPCSTVSSTSHRTRVSTTCLLHKLLLRQAHVAHIKRTFTLIVVTANRMQVIQYITNYRFKKIKADSGVEKLKNKLKILHAVSVDFSQVTDEQTNILLSHTRTYHMTRKKKRKKGRKKELKIRKVILSVQEQR
jgi:hypothetical protein